LKDIRAVFELKSLFSYLRPDIIAAHSSKAGWLGRIAGYLTGVPTIFTAHGWAFTDGVPRSQRMIYLIAERFVAPLSTRIITVSESDMRLAYEHRIGKKSTLKVIHNGVPDVDMALRAKPETEPATIIMVARFSQQKDHAQLIKALSGLRNMKWHLDLIGEGESKDSIGSLARQLNIADRISFLGARRDVAQCMAKAQLFVLTSNWEGFPMTILEAMRAGLPVIASDVGGVREAVVDNCTGFLIPPGDASLLQKRLHSLIEDTGMRRKMGECGRRRYESYFTVEHMLEKTLALYQDVVSMRRC
jgi:glycosyltransferase involved in cell wall biosynthesis